ncbi:MAG: exosortase/archaeosortase family protein [Candidatus Schekmanbacteria bacterium]|nr:exosortase/archaeosortase family protein [Candidatus Schekmanbacteria bacterium]
MKNTYKNILYITIAGLIILIYRPILVWLIASWRENPDYSHGFAVPLICGWIIWKKKGKLKQFPQSSSSLGLFIILGALLILLAGRRMGVNFITAYSLIGLLIGISLYQWGIDATKEVLFPLLFLLFMIPVSQFLIDPVSYRLKLLSSYLSAQIVQSLGIPVYREGVILTTGRGALEVADPCSGIRSLFTFLMMGTVFAYLAQGTGFKKMLLFSFTIPLVILGNSIRIITAILLLNYWGISVSNTNWETAISLIIVAMTAVGLLFIGRLMKCQISAS